MVSKKPRGRLCHVERCATILPALLAFELKVRRRALRLVLILEANLLCFRRLSTCSAHLDLALIQPSLVDGRILDVISLRHTVVELELLHETVIRLTKWSCLANLGQGLIWRDAVSLHEKCAGHRC